MGRGAEAATVATLGVTLVVVGGSQSPAKGEDWSWWVLSIIALGTAIIILAVLNVVFGFLHAPLACTWRYASRIRVGLKPQLSEEKANLDAELSSELEAASLERDTLKTLKAETQNSLDRAYQTIEDQKGELAKTAVEKEALTHERDDLKKLVEAERSAGNQRLREAKLERDGLRVDLTNLKTRLESITPPVWVQKAVGQDADDLGGAILKIDEQPQNYHVLWDLEDAYEPGIIFRFTLLNSSVYTIEFSSLEGELLIDHKQVPGRFKILENQVSLIFPRRRRYNFFFKFVLETERSRQTIEELVAKCRRGEASSIYFDLDRVRLLAKTHEDPDVVAEVTFPVQFWRPSHEGK
jgi:hypothetical protein